MFWCWSHCELEELKPAEGGVAFLVLTIWMTKDQQVVAQPRRDGFTLKPGVFEMPVLRIEARQPLPQYGAEQRRKVVQMIREVAAMTKAKAIQIDFDAPPEARPFYRDLLRDVRTKLPAGTFLSMTSLAAWCTAESWMRDLPVDEIVPMAFDMGPAGDAVFQVLRTGGQFEFSECRSSLGLAVGDTKTPFARNQRVYRFPLRSGE